MACLPFLQQSWCYKNLRLGGVPIYDVGLIVSVVKSQENLTPEEERKVFSLKRKFRIEVFPLVLP